MPPRKKTAEGANAAKEKENVEQNEQGKSMFTIC